MKLLLLSSLCVLVHCAHFVEIKEEQDVIVGTTNNWEEVVTDTSIVLVEFCKFLIL